MVAPPCKSYLHKTLITLQASPSQLINNPAHPKILRTLIRPTSYKILKETLALLVDERLAYLQSAFGISVLVHVYSANHEVDLYMYSLVLLYFAA